ncbi:MAG: OmpA family protein [Bacteroidota bacterium]
MGIFVLRFAFKLFFFSFLIVSTVFAQRSTRDLNKTGDLYFDQLQYYEAVPYYEQSLQINSKDRHALYKLAECHRNLFEYKEAQARYKKVADLYPSNYPLSLYYYPLMQKFNGKFDEAIVNFDLFLEFAKNTDSKALEEEPIYIEQAKVEKEGCILALNQLSSPVRDFTFRLLPKPLNSEYNDYSAAPYKDDESAVLASGRSGGRGRSVNSRSGELFADIYRFKKEGESWKEIKVKDNFDDVNTKWGDGSGVFTRDGNKFYFTRCNENNTDNCLIYVTTVVDGKWIEPIPLNKNINLPKSDSRHPALSNGGDTLFFSSDRKGGQGGRDIWLSTSSGSENWGPAINMGDQINTVFNEISPYFFSEENTLFFASDGHRGFGGLDMYFAKGYDLFNPEIYNMGFPFNSNKDDAFFVLGINKGYLTSNRTKGIGKFDVYSFDYNTGRAVIAEINNEKSVAGRNSVFSDDFNFDAEDQVMIEKIISVMVASKIYGVELAFTNTELNFYESLSDEDKKRVSRIVNSRVRNLSRSSLSMIRDEDEFYYKNLGEEEKEHVDGIVSKYLEEKGLNETIELNEEDEEYYFALSAQEKQKLERLIAFRLKNDEEILEEKVSSGYQSVEKTIYDNLSDQEKAWVDKASVSYAKSKANFLKLELSATEKEFYNALEQDEKLTINGAVYNKLTTLAKKPEYQLNEADRAYYGKLSKEDRELLSGIASNLLSSNSSNLFDALTSEEQDFVNNMASADRQIADRLIATLMANIADADDYTYENLSQQEKDRLERFAKAKAEGNYRNYIQGLSAEDQEHYNKLSKSEKRRIDRMVDRYARYKSARQSGLLALEEKDSELKEQSGLKSFEEETLDALIESTTKLNPEEKKQAKQILGRNYDKIPQNAIDFFEESTVQDKTKVTDLLVAVVTSSSKGINELNPGNYQSEIGFYKKLDGEEKTKVDQIVTYPILDKEEYLLNLTEEKRGEIAEVAKKYFIARTGNIVLSPAESDLSYYETSNQLGQSTIDRASALSQFENLTRLEKEYYNSLSPQERARVVGIISNSLMNNGALDAEKLEKDNKNFFNEQEDRNQRLLKGIVAAPFFNFDVDNLLFYQDLSDEDKAILSRLTKNRLTSGLALDYAKLSTEEKEYLESLSDSEREVLNRFLASEPNNLNEEGSLFYEELASEEKRIVNKIRGNVNIARGELALGLFGGGENEASSNDEEGRTTSSANKSLEEIIEEDILFYNNLTKENKKVIDRVVAIRLVKSTYESNPDLFVEDTEYYKKLDKDEKEIVKRLGRELNNTDPDSPMITDGQLNYYQRMAPEKRAKVNRLAVREALKAQSISDVKLSAEDENYFKKLPKEDKEKVDRIVQIRKASNRLMGNDLQLEIETTEDSRVVAQVNTFKAGDYDNVIVSGKLYDLISGQAAYGVEIPLLDDKGEVVKITSTNRDGSFKYINLPSGMSYSILSQIEKPKVTTPQKYFIKDLIIEGIDRSEVMNIGYDNVYFDLSSSELRPEAKSVLDELIKITNKYDQIQIEINAYTDNIGSDEFNFALSAKRGRSVFEYLVEKGADRTTLVINPRGKSNPIASNNNDFGRQFNRRVEFNITGSGLKEDLEYVTYITKPGAGIKEIAEAHEMTESELRELNNILSGEPKAYKPIRIKADVKPNTDLLFKRNATTGRVTYTVKKGDTVYSLSNKFGISQEALMGTNGLKTPQDLMAGQVLTVYQ